MDLVYRKASCPQVMLEFLVSLATTQRGKWVVVFQTNWRFLRMAMMEMEFLAELTTTQRGKRVVVVLHFLRKVMIEMEFLVSLETQRGKTIVAVRMCWRFFRMVKMGKSQLVSQQELQVDLLKSRGEGNQQKMAMPM